MSEQTDWQDGQLTVVVNDEGQYSIWPQGRQAPPGWREAGMTGTKAECLAFINEVWTDMRPLSLRKKLDGQAEDREPTVGL